jgi:hypothetical protein
LYLSIMITCLAWLMRSIGLGHTPSNMQPALSMQLLSMTSRIILCPIGDLTPASSILWGLPEMCLRGQLDEIDPSTPSFHLGGKLLPGLGHEWLWVPDSPINPLLDFSETSFISTSRDFAAATCLSRVCLTRTRGPSFCTDPMRDQTCSVFLNLRSQTVHCLVYLQTWPQVRWSRMMRLWRMTDFNTAMERRVMTLMNCKFEISFTGFILNLKECTPSAKPFEDSALP